MFRKRNFSIINSSSPRLNGSPCKLSIRESPLKNMSNVIRDSPRKLQLNSTPKESPRLNGSALSLLRTLQEPSPNGLSIVTAPPTSPPPAKRVKLSPIQAEIKVDALRNEKDSLREEIKSLKSDIDEKFAIIKETKEKTLELQSKRNTIDDYIEIAGKGQVEVRNLLNDIFNPGSQLASRASHLIEEAKRRHQQKYEKLVFEMTNILETCEEAIRKKTKQLEHDAELHKRTILTIECQKRQQMSIAMDKKAKERQPEQSEHLKTPETTKSSMLDGTPKDNSNQEIHVDEQKLDESMDEDKSIHVDDDCIIIEESQQAMGSDPAHEIELQTSTPSPIDNNTSHGNEGDNSGTTATAEFDEDEDTDIDDQKDDEVQRSFTPCQAQRMSNK